MPPMIRCQFFFEESGPGSNGTGWSETHYYTPATSLASAMTDLRVLAAARVKLLGAGVVLRYLRVSDDNVFRDSRSDGGPVPLQGPNGPYYWPAFRDKPADFSYSVALIRVDGAQDFYRKSLYLSGAPDEAQEIINPVPVGGQFVGNYANWRTVMTNGKWGFKVLQQTAPNAPRPITSIVAGLFTTSFAHNFVVNTIVRIRGFQPTTGNAGIGNPNGLWQVETVPSGTTFSLRGYAQLGFTPTRMGTARAQIFEITPYTSLFVRRFGSHKRGRPFGQLRGRIRRRAP